MSEDLKARLQEIADGDVAGLVEADRQYGSSWCKRGGVGAYMVTVRKVDRMEERVKRHGYDVFLALEKEGYRDGLLDDIRDLRRYLMLIEAEHLRLQAEGGKAARDRPEVLVGKLDRSVAMETQKTPKFQVGERVLVQNIDGTYTSAEVSSRHWDGSQGWFYLLLGVSGQFQEQALGLPKGESKPAPGPRGFDPALDCVPKFRIGDTVCINGFDHLGTVTSVGYDGWYEFTVKGEGSERRWTVDESALRLIHRESAA